MKHDQIPLNTPVSDPLWPDNLFPFELLNFAVGQVIGDDMGGLGAGVVDVELASMQHHQPAQLICAWLYTQTYKDLWPPITKSESVHALVQVNVYAKFEKLLLSCLQEWDGQIQKHYDSGHGHR